MKMKSVYYTLLSFLALLFCLQTTAQKKFNEGTILYDITINTGTDKPQNADFFNGATNAVYIKGNKTRTEMVSSLGTQSIIITQAPPKKEITILKEFGDKKYMINLTAAEWIDINKKYENVSFTYDASATKNIQGYAAKKAIGYLSDSSIFTVWYTPEIIVDSKDFQYINRNLPGLALEYETTFGSTKVTYTVSKINFSPVPAQKFELPKTGFRVLSYAESKGMR